MNVRLFAGLSELVGQAEVNVDLPADATAGDLLSRLQAMYPAAAGLLSRSAVAVEQGYCRAHERIVGDDVAVLPPVSGG